MDRFRKLAGLINEDHSKRIDRNFLSEERVSQLLRQGYTYGDIALMEQAGPEPFVDPVTGQLTEPPAGPDANQETPITIPTRRLDKIPSNYTPPSITRPGDPNQPPTANFPDADGDGIPDTVQGPGEPPTDYRVPREASVDQYVRDAFPTLDKLNVEPTRRGKIRPRDLKKALLDQGIDPSGFDDELMGQISDAIISGDANGFLQIMSDNAGEQIYNNAVQLAASSNDQTAVAALQADDNEDGVPDERTRVYQGVYNPLQVDYDTADELDFEEPEEEAEPVYRDGKLDDYDYDTKFTDVDGNAIDSVGIDSNDPEKIKAFAAWVRQDPEKMKALGLKNHHISKILNADPTKLDLNSDVIQKINNEFGEQYTTEQLQSQIEAGTVIDRRPEIATQIATDKEVISSGEYLDLTGTTKPGEEVPAPEEPESTWQDDLEWGFGDQHDPEAYADQEAELDRQDAEFEKQAQADAEAAQTKHDHFTGDKGWKSRTDLDDAMNMYRKGDHTWDDPEGPMYDLAFERLKSDPRFAGMSDDEIKGSKKFKKDMKKSIKSIFKGGKKEIQTQWDLDQSLSKAQNIAQKGNNQRAQNIANRAYNKAYNKSTSAGVSNFDIDVRPGAYQDIYNQAPPSQITAGPESETGPTVVHSTNLSDLVSDKVKFRNMPTQYKKDWRKNSPESTRNKLKSALTNLVKGKDKSTTTPAVDPNYTSPENKSGMSDADYAKMYS